MLRAPESMLREIGSHFHHFPAIFYVCAASYAAMDDLIAEASWYYTTLSNALCRRIVAYLRILG